MKYIFLVLVWTPLVSPGQSPGKSFLDGKFTAPAGVTVVIQKDGVDDLTLTAPAGSGQTYTTINFKFPKEYANGTPYTVAVKSVPTGITCRIEKGVRGTIGVSPGFMRVGADYAYDHLSRSTDNKSFGTFYDSQAPVLGGAFEEEGRYVAFVSSAVGLDQSNGRNRQIFWRDRKTGVTKMVSRAPGGEEGNGDSFAPSISSDGKSVAFESYATNLTSGDNNKVRDVFKWNSLDNSIVMVSQNGAPGNSESFEPSISGDGNLVAYSSGASNLTPGVDGNSTINIFLKDFTSGTTRLISMDPKTGKGVGGSRPSISDNGARVAFCSFAWTLVEDDKNNLWDIFIYDNSSPKLKRVSMGMGGTERQQGDESASRVVAPSISGDGNYVAYATTAPNIVTRDNNKLQDVFVTGIDNMTTVRVSIGSNGVESDGDSPITQGEKIGISFDGSLITFSTKATNLGVPAGNVVMYNMFTREINAISRVEGVQAGRPAISRNGGYVAFGMGTRLDGRHPSSGLFAAFTGLTRCLACNE
jgi:hypothetical protein